MEQTTEFPEQSIWENKRKSIVESIKHSVIVEEKKREIPRKLYIRKSPVIPAELPIIPEGNTLAEKRERKRKDTICGDHTFILTGSFPSKNKLYKMVCEYRTVTAKSADIITRKIRMESIGLTESTRMNKYYIPVVYYSSNVGSIDLTLEKQFAYLVLQETRENIPERKDGQREFWEENPRVSMDHVPMITERKESLVDKVNVEKRSL